MTAGHFPTYIVDAFSKAAFGGNPAGVCLLGEDISDDVKQSIAVEMNLSATAFVVPCEENNDSEAFRSCGKFSISWFTPMREVPLCGHATLASAAVLFYERNNVNSSIEFITRKRGSLHTKKALSQPGAVQMALPLSPADQPVEMDESWAIIEACIGSEHRSSISKAAIAPACSYIMLAMDKSFTRSQLEELVPNIQRMFSLPMAEEEQFIGIVVTCGDEADGEFDFVSRFFAPWLRIDEDAVTGSAHTITAPYWAEELGKTTLQARQCSERGGVLSLEVLQDSVLVTGCTRTVLEGRIRA